MQIRKILLVDDDPDLRLVGRACLARVGGWEVVEACSGAEALDQAASERPDAILLDVMMPGMDGPTTLLKLRQTEATADIPVVFLTAKAQKSEIERYHALGAAGVIVKPFDPMQLPSRVLEILRAA